MAQHIIPIVLIKNSKKTGNTIPITFETSSCFNKIKIKDCKKQKYSLYLLPPSHRSHKISKSSIFSKKNNINANTPSQYDFYKKIKQRIKVKHFILRDSSKLGLSSTKLKNIKDSSKTLLSIKISKLLQKNSKTLPTRKQLLLLLLLLTNDSLYTMENENPCTDETTLKRKFGGENSTLSQLQPLAVENSHTLLSPTLPHTTSSVDTIDNNTNINTHTHTNNNSNVIINTTSNTNINSNSIINTTSNTNNSIDKSINHISEALKLNNNTYNNIKYSFPKENELRHRDHGLARRTYYSDSSIELSYFNPYFNNFNTPISSKQHQPGYYCHCSLCNNKKSKKNKNTENKKNYSNYPYTLKFLNKINTTSSGKIKKNSNEVGGDMNQHALFINKNSNVSTSLFSSSQQVSTITNTNNNNNQDTSVNTITRLSNMNTTLFNKNSSSTSTNHQPIKFKIESDLDCVVENKVMNFLNDTKVRREVFDHNNKEEDKDDDEKTLDNEDYCTCNCRNGLDEVKGKTKTDMDFNNDTMKMEKIQDEEEEMMIINKNLNLSLNTFCSYCRRRRSSNINSDSTLSPTSTTTSPMTMTSDDLNSSSSSSTTFLPTSSDYLYPQSGMCHFHSQSKDSMPCDDDDNMFHERSKSVTFLKDTLEQIRLFNTYDPPTHITSTPIHYSTGKIDSKSLFSLKNQRASPLDVLLSPFTPTELKKNALFDHPVRSHRSLAKYKMPYHLKLDFTFGDPITTEPKSTQSLPSPNTSPLLTSTPHNTPSSTPDNSPIYSKAPFNLFSEATTPSSTTINSLAPTAPRSISNPMTSLMANSSIEATPSSSSLSMSSSAPCLTTEFLSNGYDQIVHNTSVHSSSKEVGHDDFQSDYSIMMNSKTETSKNQPNHDMDISDHQSCNNNDILKLNPTTNVDDNDEKKYTTKNEFFLPSSQAINIINGAMKNHGRSSSYSYDNTPLYSHSQSSSSIPSPESPSLLSMDNFLSNHSNRQQRLEKETEQNSSSSNNQLTTTTTIVGNIQSISPSPSPLLSDVNRDSEKNNISKQQNLDHSLDMMTTTTTSRQSQSSNYLSSYTSQSSPSSVLSLFSSPSSPCSNSPSSPSTPNLLEKEIFPCYDDLFDHSLASDFSDNEHPRDGDMEDNFLFFTKSKTSHPTHNNNNHHHQHLYTNNEHQININNKKN